MALSKRIFFPQDRIRLKNKQICLCVKGPLVTSEVAETYGKKIVSTGLQPLEAVDMFWM